MTAISIWCNHENRNPSLWIAADSRVNTVGGSILIEDAAKVFSLPVVCRSPGKDGFFSKIYYTHTLGYCFAGSTLMGQNAILGITPLLTNLISTNLFIPALSDIARHAHAFISRSFNDYKEKVGPTALFEAAIFGYCHKENQLSIFRFTPTMVNGSIEITLTPHKGLGKNDFIYLGDEKEKMSAEIASAFSGKNVPGRPISRIPRYVIEDKIKDLNFPSIGGDIQLAIADQLGFYPMTICRPRLGDEPNSYLSYLGRELTNDIAFVGEAMVGMTGMI